ncbi:MAG: hypothetical protein ACI4MA_10085, partial [Treponema sp.]
AGARGRLPPLYTLNGRFGCHFLTQLALASVTKNDELAPNSLEKLAGLQKIPPQSSIFLISLKYDLWLHSGKYGQADCGKSAV